MESFSEPPACMDSALAQKLVTENDCFIFDCDGVLWKWSKMFEHVADFLNYLITKLKKQVFFVTNNSTKSRASYVNKLRAFGVTDIDETNVISTSWLVAEYLKSINFKGKVYAIAEDGVADELKKIGIDMIGNGPDPYPAHLDYGSLAVDIDSEIKCVIVGFDRNISLLKILKACSYIKQSDCLFIATNDDPNFPSCGTDTSIVYPGTGSILASVITACGIEPKILGKPHSFAFEMMEKLYCLDPCKCLMIGDRLETDIVFGKRHGLNTMAVFSGITNLNEINDVKKKEIGSSYIPDYYVSDLTTFWLLLKQ